MTEEDIQTLLSRACLLLSDVSSSAMLDAEILLSHCIKKPRSYLRAWPEKQLDTSLCELYYTLVCRRQQGQPLAYITGVREFWSRDFIITQDVLIPRPDTELLIDLSLKLIPDNQAIRLIDLGTGSGIIAVTLAAEKPDCEVIATDLNLAALNVARENAKRHQLSNIVFKQSCWFAEIETTDLDLVISNPPYIAVDDPHLLQNGLQFEPRNALVSANQGLQDICLIANQARSHLKPHGHLLIEHGYNQQSAVQTIFRNLNYHQVITHHDLAGNPRVTRGIWNP